MVNLLSRSLPTAVARCLLLCESLQMPAERGNQPELSGHKFRPVKILVHVDYVIVYCGHVMSIVSDISNLLP